MTTPVAADEVGVRLARGATGLLAQFNVAGVLAPADVHVAERLGRLGGETDETVLLAAALAVRALRAGSVCLDLREVDRTVLAEGDEVVDTSDLPWPAADTWLAACAASPLVGRGTPGHPLQIVDGLLYLDRYWRQEEQVRLDLRERAAAAAPPVDADRLRAALDRLFRGHAGGHSDAQQRRATAVSTLRWVSVLAGGPGTGKTTTLARLLAVLRDQDPALRIALAAPTGKAAARMQEAIAAVELPPEDRARVGAPSASTLHRLLGPRRESSGRFRYDRHHRLPYDVVVVDETSMVPLTMVARLLEAVRPDARVVLVGDPDQLASVEAGAVLGDLVRAPGEPDDALARVLDDVGCPGDPVVHGVSLLAHNWRFGGAIGDLATAIRDGRAEDAVAALRRAAPDVAFVETSALEDREPAGLEGLREEIVAGMRETALAAALGKADDALHELDQHRLLCAHRRGPFGVTRWARQVEWWLAEADADPAPDPAADLDAAWYPGRPLLITANDYDLGLYNGDTGVVVDTPTGPRAVFARGGAQIWVAPALLDQVQTVHAMTVHRAQGSQFAEVSVILPPPESPLLTRELLYTAVTRAEHRVRLIGSEEAVRAAVARPINRASGLRWRLSGGRGVRRASDGV